MNESKILVVTDLNVDVKTYHYNGRCIKCFDHVKITSIYPNDKLCYECMWNIKKNKKRIGTNVV